MKRNVLSIRRHEERDGDNLTPNGMCNAETIGEQLEGKLWGICYSTANRSKQTAKGILEGYSGEVGAAYVKEVQSLDVLDSPFPEGIEDRDAIFDYWLDNYNGREQDMYKAGLRVLEFVLNLWPIGDNEVSEFITHAPNIESALINLVDPRMRMKDIGGSFKTGENFKIIKIYTDSSLDVTAEFRGEQWDVTDNFEKYIISAYLD